MNKSLMFILLIVIAAAAGVYLMSGRDERGLGERIDDAAAQMDQGLDEAADQLKDKTPAEKVGDAIGDAADDVKRKLSTP